MTTKSSIARTKKAASRHANPGVRPTPSPGTPGEGRGEGDLERRQRAAPKKTLPPPLSRSSGSGRNAVPAQNGSARVSARKSVLAPQAQPNFDLTISAKTPAARKLIPLLNRQLRKAHQLLRPRLQELSIALVNDSQMSDLHHEFLGLTGPTDVLTFELEHEPDNCVTSGEIAICVPEAKRQARERGGKIENEVLLYAVHGLLHLCGFDDKTDRGFRAMHRREDEILTALGVGPVFRSEPTRQRSGAV